MPAPALTPRRPAPSDRVRVRRVARKAVYELDAIKAILEEALVAHLGLFHDGQPFVIPTMHAVVGDEVLVHGSAASRTLRALGGGIPACLTVTILDGMVFARSVFEMSANYRSVVVVGDARPITDPGEKLEALRAFTEKVMPGRWDEARGPTRQELKGTSILALPLSEASAKVSTGGPDDGQGEDALRPVWAGHVPVRLVAGEPVPCPHLRPGIGAPAGLTGFLPPTPSA